MGLPRNSVCGSLLALACGTAGCASYAPPIRAIHGGAPGRLAPGQLEVGVGVSGTEATLDGGGTLGYAIRRGLAVHAGVDGARDGGGTVFTMGWAGLSTPFRWHFSPRGSLAAAGEAGVGVGAGGEGCDSVATCNAEPKWDDRIAGGGYLGGAGAIRGGPISVYVRTRGQVASAEAAPTTYWGSVFGGLQVHSDLIIDFWAGAGYAALTNDKSSTSGLVVECGLARRFAVGRTARNKRRKDQNDDRKKEPK